MTPFLPTPFSSRYQRAILPMRPIKPLRIEAIHMAQQAALIGRRCAEAEMILIPHQTIGKHLDAPQRMGVTQHLKKGLVIGRIAKDGLPRQPAVHHMIDCARILYREC